MHICKAFRFRVYPTQEQVRRIVQWEGALRFLWNLAMEQRRMGLARTDKKYPTAFDQINEKGSKNREKAKVRVMRLQRKTRRQREHFLHVESARLAKSHGTVVIEKLNVAGMIRSRLARSIADAGWSMFADMLRYKLAWSGGQLVEVPAHYSSQTCFACGVVDAKSRHGERFCCTACGNTDHADLNAAKVLKNRANRSVLPGEGLPPEGPRRARKVKIGLRVPRRPLLQSPSL